MRSDEELVASYLAGLGDTHLSELVDRHLGRVRSTVYAMVLDPAAADDLTQEVFCRAIGGLGSFGGRARFSTWLYRITMNTVRGFLARRRRSSR